MKTIPILIAAPLLLALGVLAGREFFPRKAESEAPTPPLSERSERKTIQVARSTEGEIQSSPTDIPGLLELVDPQDHFTTSTKLRKALGNLSPGALENLLLDLSKHDKGHPGFMTLRFSVLNHLVAKDPFHALDFILAQDDAQFRTSSISTILQGAARIDLKAAREALDLLKDPALLATARHALNQVGQNASAEELLAHLQETSEDGNIATNFYYGNSVWGYNSWSPHFYHSMNHASSALSQLAQKDLAAAEAHARGLENPHQRNSALSQIAVGLAEKDPEGALEWARNIDTGDGRDQVLTSILGIMSRKDPAKAAGLLGEITNLQFRNSAVSSIVSLWAQNDPHAATAWVDQLPANQTKINAYSTISHQLAQTDPLGAIALLDKIPGNTSQNILPNVLNQWIARDFEAARNWITEQKNPFRLDQAIPSLISNWVHREPAQAAAFLAKTASEIPTRNMRGHFSTLGTQWAATDPTAALAWANELDNSEFSKMAKSGIFQQWGSRNPAEAAQHLGSLSDTTERQQLLGSIARNWINSDPEAAQGWLASLPFEDRFTAKSSALSSLSHQQPAQAAEFYNNMLREAGDNEEQLRRFQSQASQIASSWGQHDPSAAAEWAQSLPGENERASAYQSVANQWVQFAPAETASWIDSLPVGKPRDSATESLVQNIQHIDPDSAFDWADTISDQSRRYSHIQSIISQWKTTDPEAARAAVASANITDKQRENLMRRFQ